MSSPLHMKQSKTCRDPAAKAIRSNNSFEYDAGKICAKFYSFIYMYSYLFMQKLKKFNCNGHIKCVHVRGTC